MPWRLHTEPYYILVSEVMLQQTQVSRVIPKFEAFLQLFPTIQHLSESPLAEVLNAWSGLGYNRRAKFLHEAAKQIVAEHGGHIPQELGELKKLPGVGHNTAAAIVVYAFNHPNVFIETNIRSVYIHHFFASEKKVSDAELLPLIEATLDPINPREWYWALMDYGAYIKATFPNPSRNSTRHIKQSKFQGSDRQLRGTIVRLLLHGPLRVTDISERLNDPRTPDIIKSLEREGLLKVEDGVALL